MVYYFNEEFDNALATVAHTHNYVWSVKDRAFIKYSGLLFDQADYLPSLGQQVLVTNDRLTHEKHLLEPMVFMSPTKSCEWVMEQTGVPATYGNRPLIFQDLRRHVQPNGLIINISQRTFGWDSPEKAPFGSLEDGVIFTVLDTNGETIRPGSLFEPGETVLIAENPRQAKMILKHILALKL